MELLKSLASLKDGLGAVVAFPTVTIVIIGRIFMFVTYALRRKYTDHFYIMTQSIVY